MKEREKAHLLNDQQSASNRNVLPRESTSIRVFSFHFGTIFVRTNGAVVLEVHEPEQLDLYAEFAQATDA